MSTMTLQIDRPSQAVAAPPTVACFGRYEVLVPLGEGGDARVYIGQTRGPSEVRRLVAIKHITSDVPHQEQWAAAAREARVGARIRHGNVVGVLEVEDGGIGPYLVMEYVEGGTLVDLLSRCFERTSGREGIPVGIAVRIAMDTLFGLHAAHELRDEHGQPFSLVHRDVSPHNILVGVDGVTRIGDFGIARLRHAIHTAPGLVRGKAGYMAPEQILGAPLDRRTDVFALGIVLWEALTGNRLFRGKRLEDIVSSVLEQPIVTPAQYAPATPNAVADVCLRALERDPRNRWPTARAFADALTAATRAGSGVASQGEVADYVESVLGDVLARRRAAVRAGELEDGAASSYEPEPLTVRAYPSTDPSESPTATSELRAPVSDVRMTAWFDQRSQAYLPDRDPTAVGERGRPVAEHSATFRSRRRSGSVAIKVFAACLVAMLMIAASVLWAVSASRGHLYTW